MAWVRRVRTASGATAVQIAESVAGHRRIVRHVGSARDEVELGLWMAAARRLLVDDAPGSSSILVCRCRPREQGTNPIGPTQLRPSHRPLSRLTPENTSRSSQFGPGRLVQESRAFKVGGGGSGAVDPVSP